MLKNEKVGLFWCKEEETCTEAPAASCSFFAHGAPAAFLGAGGWAEKGF